MRVFCFVELQGTGDRIQHAVGHAAERPTLEAVVVAHTAPGQLFAFLAAQAGDPPSAPVGRQARLLRSDSGPPGGQELPDVVPAVHTSQATVTRPGYGCTASTWNPRPCLTPCQLGSHGCRQTKHKEARRWAPSRWAAQARRYGRPGL